MKVQALYNRHRQKRVKRLNFTINELCKGDYWQKSMLVTAWQSVQYLFMEWQRKGTRLEAIFPVHVDDDYPGMRTTNIIWCVANDMNLNGEAAEL